MGLLDKLFGSTKNKCSVCGHKFSDQTLSGDTMFLDWISQKGLRCSSCGRLYCPRCMPTDPDGTHRCKCGNTGISLDG
jgi:hypothetical protein